MDIGTLLQQTALNIRSLLPEIVFHAVYGEGGSYADYLSREMGMPVYNRALIRGVVCFGL